MSSKRPLSDEQLRSYRENGFLVVPDVFSLAEIDEMRRAFERLQAQAEQLRETQLFDGSQFVVEPVINGVERVRIHRVVWCGSAQPVLSRFGQDPRLVSMALQILGADSADQLINQAHLKLPGDKVDFPWHQDSRHRRFGTDLWRDVNGEGSFVETATAVDPMTHANGPLVFIKGSNRLGHLSVDPHTKALPVEALESGPEVVVTLRPGSVALFGPYVIHGSGPNQSDQPRRLFLNGFASPGANSRVYPGDGAGRAVSLS